MSRHITDQAQPRARHIDEGRLPAAKAFGIVQNATLHRRFLFHVKPGRPTRHSFAVRAPGLGALLMAALTCACAAQTADEAIRDEEQPQAHCLPSGDGYVRARLSGAINAEVDWPNEGTECAGAVRPDGGLRLRFSRFEPESASKIVLVFGVAGLKEGQSARSLPVNVTVIREGAGEFYSTQGDDKCMLDEVEQTALVGPPFKARTYRVVARGYCMEPARAVQGKGALLLSRFDFAGAVNFETEDASNDEMVANR